MVERMYCEQCDEWIVPLEGVTALFQMGCWWCAKHCNILCYNNGKPIVDFPSDGKLLPKTIMTEK